ncbi:hypothetical protein BV20DRAFT_1051588 [Pilatotrama ljubarskyi]|nr:hypothetical protein BV20DRAFT_1051588 [Pilatotrama ljubarskyi]
MKTDSNSQEAIDPNSQLVWWAVLGKGLYRKTIDKYVPLCVSATYTTDQLPHRPFITGGGKYVDSFPIVFKVWEEKLADEVLMFRDAMKEIEKAKNTTRQVELALTLPGTNTILLEYLESSYGQGMYPVVYGHECAIFLTHTDTLNATKGLSKTIWKKVPTFGRAVAYMLSKGESEKSDEYRKMISDHMKLEPKHVQQHSELPSSTSQQLPATPTRCLRPAAASSFSPTV